MSHRNSIGGQLTYAALASLHRPRCRTEMAAAARELASQGFTANDVAVCLQITPQAAQQLLNTTPSSQEHST